jgi:hypothetical protein
MITAPVASRPRLYVHVLICHLTRQQHPGYTSLLLLDFATPCKSSATSQFTMKPKICPHCLFFAVYRFTSYTPYCQRLFLMKIPIPGYTQPRCLTVHAVQRADSPRSGLVWDSCQPDLTAHCSPKGPAMNGKTSLATTRHHRHLGVMIHVDVAACGYSDLQWLPCWGGIHSVLTCVQRQQRQPYTADTPLVRPVNTFRRSGKRWYYIQLGPSSVRSSLIQDIVRKKVRPGALIEPCAVSEPPSREFDRWP